MIAKQAIDRRAVVKAGAVAALVAAGSPYIVKMTSAYAADGEDVAEGAEAGAAVGQVGFLVKPKNCLNCHACVDACRKINETPDEEPARRKITKYQAEEEVVFVSSSCMHCIDPACATVCPAGAIVKGDAGIVSVNPERCIGCKYCYQACPFGVPHYNSESMDKCDCCLGNGVVPGETPPCAEACNFGALHFGTVEALLEKYPDAKVIESSTQPSMYLA